MSRSNPNENAPHPCEKWFEWNGETGEVRYYDKDKKTNVVIGSDFTFLLLDRLSTIKGYNERAKKGMYSNEVRDLKKEALVVKCGGNIVAEGFYQQIKDRVNNLGGSYAVNCYMVFKEEGVYKIGSMMLKGAALGPWIDFEKANRDALYKKAIRIFGSTNHKKGKVEFKAPKFFLREVDEKSDEEASRLDAEKLQPYLKAYFARTATDQLDQRTPHSPEDENQARGGGDDVPDDTRDHSQGDPDLDPPDSDIPF